MIRSFPQLQEMDQVLKAIQENSPQKTLHSPASIQYNAGKHFITLTVQHVMVRMVSHRLPKNPTQSSVDSVQRGQALYNTYCAACHGEDGQSQTVVVEKGVPAPPITGFFQMPTAAPHLYNKIKYGSFFQEPRGFMPSYGAQTSVRDRWDMVNYMMSATFGKGSSQ